jgi:dTDP-4-dehydrorhamnose reductase
MLGRDLVETLRCSFPKDEITGWDVEEIDIQEESNTVTRIRSLEPSVIVHLAAYTDVDGCELNERKLSPLMRGMKHMALGAATCGAKVVTLSTDYIFDGKKEPLSRGRSSKSTQCLWALQMEGEQYVRELVRML